MVAAVAEGGTKVAVRQWAARVGGDGAASELLTQLDAAAPTVQLAQVEEHGGGRAIRREAQGGLPLRLRAVIVTTLRATQPTVIVVDGLSAHGVVEGISTTVRRFLHLVLLVVHEVALLDPHRLSRAHEVVVWVDRHKHAALDCWPQHPASLAIEVAPRDQARENDCLVGHEMHFARRGAAGRWLQQAYVSSHS